MEIVILGSGTSHGVPMIGCRCDVCLSTNPLNRRFRPSILVKGPAGNVLVDTTPEFRMQCLTFDVRKIDAVLVTHTHADHIMGLDDIRRFNDMSGNDMPIYGDRGVLEDIRRIYPYIFKETQVGGGKPRVSLNEIDNAFELCGMAVEALIVLHGRLPVTAYRFEHAVQGSEETVKAAYVTDVSTIPSEAMDRLYNLDLLILDAVRFEPHPTHFGLYQSLEVVQQLRPARTLFTHLSHHFDHETVNAMLPDTVKLAYDGQNINL